MCVLTSVLTSRANVRWSFALHTAVCGLIIFMKGISTSNISELNKMDDSQSPFDDLEYFNKSDARDITWAHAVNSQEKLDMYLKTEILMFEADVLMRFNRDDTVPVMAHPPDDDSNLTLEVFIKSVKPTSKGIKLDFKTILAVEPSMNLLSNILGATKKPLWLNADILPGPGSNSKTNKPVDATLFIDTCTKTYPSSTLSLGWTTDWSESITSEGYTQDMVKQMQNICKNTTQVITFPVRAVYVRRSWEQLKWLLGSSFRYTLTIWSSVGDAVDVNDLVWLTKQVDKRRLYMDLPPELDAQLDEALASVASKAIGYVTNVSGIVACLSLLVVNFME